jgi:hypothetical protein
VKNGAQVVSAVADVDDLVERFPSAVALHPCLKLVTLAHVRAATDLASVLNAVGVDPSVEHKEAVVAPLCRVGDDLVDNVVDTVLLEDGLDVDVVGVGEDGVGALGVGGSLERLDAASHGGVLHRENVSTAVGEHAEMRENGGSRKWKGRRAVDRKGRKTDEGSRLHSLDDVVLSETLSVELAKVLSAAKGSGISK